LLGATEKKQDISDSLVRSFVRLSKTFGSATHRVSASCHTVMSEKLQQLYGEVSEHHYGLKIFIGTVIMMKE
jgi:hypothetical protein